jgi:hypothetical protein
MRDVKSVTLHKICAKQPSRGRRAILVRTFITPDVPGPRRSLEILSDDLDYEELCEKMQDGPSLKRSDVVFEAFMKFVIECPCKDTGPGHEIVELINKVIGPAETEFDSLARRCR